MDNAIDVAALDRELQAIVSQDVAFLRAGEGTRHSVGPDAVAEAARTFYMMLASGFFGAVLMEVVKGSVKEIGRALGVKVQGLLSRLFGAEEPKPDQTLVGATATLFAEARAELTDMQFGAALEAGRSALEERLLNDGFPPQRARKVADAFMKVVAESGRGEARA